MFSLSRKKIMFPDTDWLIDAERTSRYTPDVPTLEEKSHHLVFFCGEHMKKRYAHAEVNSFEFKATAFTKDIYYHWKRNLGLSSFTIPMLAPDNPKPGVGQILPQPVRIKGELYLLPTEAVFSLDEYRENGVVFRRQRRKLLVPVRVTQWVKDRSRLEEKLNQVIPVATISWQNTYVISAWIYEGVPAYWNDQFDAGYAYSPVSVFKPKKNIFGNYSYFTRLENESAVFTQFDNTLPPKQ